jgi:DNA polymerase-4
MLGSFGLELRALANGHDERPVVPDREAKSIGAEDTFEEDLAGQDALLPHIHSQALRVGRRLRKAGVSARAVVLKIKYSDFKVLTRRTTLPSPTDDGLELHRAATELLRNVPLDRRVRLTGISAHELVTGERQLGLFETASRARARKLNDVLDKIADRFGSHAMLPADLVSSEPRGGDDELRRQIGAARIDRPKGQRS